MKKDVRESRSSSTYASAREICVANTA